MVVLALVGLALVDLALVDRHGLVGHMALVDHTVLFEWGQLEDSRAGNWVAVALRGALGTADRRTRPLPVANTVAVHLQGTAQTHSSVHFPDFPYLISEVT